MIEDLYILGLGGICSLLILSLTFAFLLVIRLRIANKRITELHSEAKAEFAQALSKLSSVGFLEDYSKRLEMKIEERTRELKLERDKLGSAYEELKKLDKMKDEFLSNVSHELRTPLTSIKGVVDYMLDENITEDYHELLSVANTNTNRLDKLIGDILEFVKIERGPKEPLEEITLDNVIDQAIQEMTPIADENQVALKVSMQDDMLKVKVYESLLKKAIINLLDNAVKFNKKGGEVVVETKHKEGENFVEVRVSDTGIGIPEEHLDRIFARFYQLDGSITRKYGGVGLGLALAKGIIELHGGNIQVESEVGEGTTFWFTLPLNGDNKK